MDGHGEIAALDATGQADLIRRGEVTAAELVQWAIERIERLNPTLNAVVTSAFEQALDVARSGSVEPFGGVPYLLKDLIVECKGMRFTEGSRFLRDYISTYDSELVIRLRRAGLIILGKTNTPEFGMVPTCEPALFGPTHNPSSLLKKAGNAGGRCDWGTQPPY